MDTGKAHCDISPSSLPARSVCPCHEAAAGGADADSGTRSHAALAALLTGAEIPDGVTDDERARAEWGAKTIAIIRDDTAPGAEIHSETRAECYRCPPLFSFAAFAALVDRFGTVDAWWTCGNDLFIADYKTYANADGEKSYLPQGKMYAALLATNMEPAPTRATFYTVAAGSRGVVADSFPIAEAADEVAEIIRRVEVVRGLFKSGEEARAKCARPSSWCNTCAHAKDCPALSVAVAEYSGEVAAAPRSLAFQMALIPAVESRIKAIKAEVKERLTKGERVFDEGTGAEYGLAEKRAPAKLADLRGLVEALTIYGVKPDDIAAAVSITQSAIKSLMTQADEAAGRKVKAKDRDAVYLPYFTPGATVQYVKRIDTTKTKAITNNKE